jgi:metal-responsive CopG/Arc/MetJ family transcriptional regulator
MSAAHSRFTVSVPTTLLARADTTLRHEGEGRSALVQRLLEEALRRAQEKADEEAWVRAYREQPVTDDEVGWMTSPEILAHLADSPWDDAAG